MAEELARSKVVLKGRLLTNIIKNIKQAQNNAKDNSTTELFLTRQVTSLKEAWAEYEDLTLN